MEIDHRIEETGGLAHKGQVTCASKGTESIPLQLRIELLRDVVGRDGRVLFGYLYGSILAGSAARDIDIVAFGAEGADTYEMSADLKVALHKETGIRPDAFDVRIISGIIETGDLFALLFMKRLFERSILFVDRVPEIRMTFLEHYGMKYRECEGLIGEVLA